MSPSDAGVLAGTPARDGWWMPAEFEAHEGCWMLWPERPDNWREQARPAQAAFAAVAAAIARFEPVHVGVSAAHTAAARELLPRGVEVVTLAHDDCWMRDVGPTYLVGKPGELRGVHWRFNAWGGLEQGLYHPWDQDERVASEVLAREHRARYPAPMVIEGGAIHVDGEGTALLAEECVLNPNRNPGVTREVMEAMLREYLGVTHFIWLRLGVYNDETDGHIDNMACFVAPGKVCLTWTDDRADPQYERSHEAWERLTAARDARGRRLEVARLPMPGPLYMTDSEAAGLAPSAACKPRRGGERLAASYVNFYFANGGVVMPLLDARTDAQARETLRGLCPGREVLGVPAREILLGGGGIHCITQQVPDPRAARLRPTPPALG
ncbi:MAG: agmatine deiminase [Steroidobacteraceae bacterium]